MGRCWSLGILSGGENCLEISSRLDIERRSEGCRRLSRGTIPRMSLSELSNLQFCLRPTFHPLPRFQIRGSDFGGLWGYLRTDSAALHPLGRPES